MTDIATPEDFSILEERVSALEKDSHPPINLRPTIVEILAELGYPSIAAARPKDEPRAPQDGEPAQDVRQEAVDLLMQHDDAPELDLEQAEDLLEVLHFAGLLNRRPFLPPRETPESVRERAFDVLSDSYKGTSREEDERAVGALADAGLLASHAPGPLVVTMEECEEMATLLGDALHVGMPLDGEAIRDVLRHKLGPDRIKIADGVG